METAGSQVQAVSGSHTVKINGNMGINTGPETVVVGGALLEQVGNPVQGAIHLGVSALTTALSFAAGGDSALGKALEAGLKYGAGVVLNTAINTALAYNDGGEEAAKDALAAGLQEGVMHAASELTHLPGLDALETAVKSALPAFKGPPEVAKKAGKPVGATTGDATQAGGGQGGPGPGHRVNMVNGAMTEAIGGPHVYATPGLNKWTTVGACTIVVGGSHNIRAAKVSSRTAGALEDASGSLNITAGAAIVRKAKASVSRNISGAMSWKAGGIIAAHGSSASLSVGGALKAKGSNVVFVCGGSVFAVTPGGVVLKSSSVTFNGVTVSTGKWVLP
jgi:type VI secretion system secreted protein VgrG